MTGRIILVPTDFSEASRAALRYAESLARDWQARLVILHVHLPEPLYGAAEMYSGIYPTEESVFREMLDRFVPQDPSLLSEHRYVIGDPVQEIVDLAEEMQAAAIVIGTHGRRGLTRLLLGSVAEGVVRRATRPVLTVKSLPDTSASDAG